MSRLAGGSGIIDGIGAPWIQYLSVEGRKSGVTFRFLFILIPSYGYSLASAIVQLTSSTIMHKEYQLLVRTFSESLDFIFTPEHTTRIKRDQSPKKTVPNNLSTQIGI